MAGQDLEIRLFAFNWLREQTELYGDVLSRKILEYGFSYKGRQITLVGPQGIWKPQTMKIPISITTIPDGPYSDSFRKDGFLNYKYRGEDPYHANNVGLRVAMKEQIPLIYFFRIFKGKYLATWPVYIVGDDISTLTFKVAVDDHDYVMNQQSKPLYKLEDNGNEARRKYITASVKTRIHQRSFRERVLAAYRNQCALCRLRHAELLDAAHIIPDMEKEGLPVVQNGLSLCKIHHAAFDQHIIGITPDYIIQVRKDILEEIDGPMLKYGLQKLNRQKLYLPKKKELWPDKDRLDSRFGRFLRA